MSFRTNSRLATGSQRSSEPTVQRQNPPRMKRCAPSCAFVNPCAYKARCSTAPRVTNAAAVVHRSMRGRGSSRPCKYPMTACDAHSLGRNGDVGPRRRMRKSSRLRNPSGRASCSGRMTRKRRITPPAAPNAMIDNRSRVRRAGKMFTSTSVTAQHGTLVHDAVGRQDRHDHQRHHPRRMQQRLTQLGEIQPQPVHRGRDEQVEVLGEEEARERRDDVRQHQDGYEGKQNEPEDLARDERSQLFDSAEIAQDEKQHAEDACPERPTDNDQNDELAAAALGALFPQPLQRGPPFGLQHVGERRLLDHVPPNTSTRSRTWAPPVSLRNSSSRLASPAWCWRRTSLTVPAATVLPCWMIAIWSHIASATSSVCVLMSTVPPRPTNCRKMSLRSRAALGSRPTIGSSTTMHSGR